MKALYSELWHLYLSLELPVFLKKEAEVITVWQPISTGFTWSLQLVILYFGINLHKYFLVQSENWAKARLKTIIIHPLINIYICFYLPFNCCICVMLYFSRNWGVTPVLLDLGRAGPSPGLTNTCHIYIHRWVLRLKASVVGDTCHLLDLSG